MEMMDELSPPRTVKARKVHGCNLCFLPIDRGENYLHSAFAQDGLAWSWREHHACRELMGAFVQDWNHYTDNGTHEGALRDEIREAHFTPPELSSAAESRRLLIIDDMDRYSC